MPDTIIVALVSLLGTAIGAFSGIRLAVYRIEQLEKKVEKHNMVAERMIGMEVRMDNVEKDICDLKPKPHSVCS